MTCFRTCTSEETERLGVTLGAQLTKPTTVLLVGGLGSGKTVLARGIFQGLGVDPSLVRSPSFSLVNEYPSPRGPVFHIDLYRLETAADFQSIPLEDILAEPTVSVVEWADRLPFRVTNPLRIEVTIENSCRRFDVAAAPPGLEHLQRPAGQDR